MENYLKSVFKVDNVSSLGFGGRGCISEGSSYKVGSRKMFVKRNSNEGVCITLFTAAILATLGQWPLDFYLNEV